MKRRRVIQLITAVLYNCNITGFAKGTIYQGSVKGLCVPGLNCYSCPGAVGACPLGSLQSALVSSKYKLPYYMLGVLLLFGIFLGRVICGFLCPFGFLQELFYKIPARKLKKSKWTRRLSLIKYVILAVFVIIIPLTYAVPGFCKFICPAGTLEGGVPLVIMNESLRRLIGWLFSWKLLLAAVIIIASVFIFRFFCRFICPLGAFYSLFSRISVFGVKVDGHKCTNCGMCVRQCRMDVSKIGDRECIQCGECKEVCPAGAVSLGIKKTVNSDKKIQEDKNITTDAELAEALNGHSIAFAYHSGKIESTSATTMLPEMKRLALPRKMYRKRWTNYFLILHNHLPIIIHEGDRKEYYTALEAWDTTQDLALLRGFLKSQTEKTRSKQIARKSDKKSTQA